MLMKSKVCGHCWVEAPNNKEGAQVGEAARLIENERARLGRPGWPRPTLANKPGPRASRLALAIRHLRAREPCSEGVMASFSAESRRVGGGRRVLFMKPRVVQKRDIDGVFFLVLADT